VIADPPPDDELAAIVAAVEAVWPRPVIALAEAEPAAPWRFSGRWWARPIPTRRDRPWIA
jgi:hypothetical protein